ncbi:response regulator transcription factor [Algoriphagus sp. SE2]|uniref:response regulator transcription factor n=1 Tax=Algoriphagus sp. SE2 TaxID=3141536 RepID=UPI0031CD5274
MESHHIISKNTLLSKGLQQYLEINSFESNVDLISWEDINNHSTLTFKNGQYIWIDVINEINWILDLCHKILQKQPLLKVFVFGEFKDLRNIKSLLKTGISGYFLPNCCIEYLKEAILKASSKNPFIDPQMSDILMKNLVQSHRSTSGKKKLTKREKQILQLIVEEYTTHEIANKLFISSCTVETHRLHLIQKMGVRNTAGLVREAICANLVY